MENRTLEILFRLKDALQKDDLTSYSIKEELKKHCDELAHLGNWKVLDEILSEVQALLPSYSSSARGLVVESIIKYVDYLKRTSHNARD